MKNVSTVVTGFVWLMISPATLWFSTVFENAVPVNDLWTYKTVVLAVTPQLLGVIAMISCNHYIYIYIYIYTYIYTYIYIYIYI